MCNFSVLKFKLNFKKKAGESNKIQKSICNQESINQLGCWSNQHDDLTITQYKKKMMIIIIIIRWPLRTQYNKRHSRHRKSKQNSCTQQAQRNIYTRLSAPDLSLPFLVGPKDITTTTTKSCMKNALSI